MPRSYEDIVELAAGPSSVDQHDSMPEYSSHDNGVLEAEPVQLQPFIHQVGGHSCVLKFNETTLCKPLIKREHLFYESMPSDLKEFTPDYRGVIEVELQEDLNGEITLMGYPLHGGNPGQRAAGERLQRSSPKPYEREMSPTSSGSETDNPSSPVMASRSKHRADNSFSVRLLRSGSIEMRTQTDTVFQSTDSKSEQKSAGFNPWSLKCHKRQLAKMRNDNQDANQKRFILLENVAARFKYPCILDLKMGTRQHGDDAPEAKKNSQMRKCANTTSKAVGLRLIGMQVFQTTSGQFVCQNKYYGRKLSVPGFKESLELFLYDGDKMRLELLDPILQRLRSLYAVVDKQDTFRFYSSSLLIMYDGIQKTVSMETREHSADSSRSRAHRNGSGNTAECSRETQGTSRDHSAGSVSESTHSHVDNLDNLNNLADVRMIDFAHSTHSGFAADAAHKGVDQGYLFGIQNLITIFEEIKQRYSGTNQTDNG